MIYRDETFELSNSYTNLPILLEFTDISYLFSIIYLICAFAIRPHEVVRVLKKNPFLTIFLAIVIISVVIYMPLYGKRAIGGGQEILLLFLFSSIGNANCENSLTFAVPHNLYNVS